MKSRNNLALPFLIIFFCISLVSFCYALNIPESPDRFVVDLAGIVDDSTEMRLNEYLQELEQKTTAQLVVLTVESLEGESIEDFSIHVAHDRWKLGQKGKDNGVLLVVSVKDRKYRIEIGYGLEGVLPDSFVGSVGRNYLVPFFRKGNLSKGVYVAVLALANEIATDSGVKITGMPKLKNHVQTVRTQRPTSFLRSIMFFIFLFLMLILFIKNPRLFLLLFLFSALGGRRSSWGSGSGGFGGFGGGGGGGFGGGGATGSW